MRSLESYRDIVGVEVLGEIYRKARKLYGKHILHINSTYHGGGVAEILNSLVPLMNDIGIDAGWRILHGNPDFFAITKKFHNALQGDAINLTATKRRLFLEANEAFSTFTHIHHDCVIVHDPQPLPLIKFSKNRRPWIWRCHIDLSHPNSNLWDFLTTFILRYHLVVLSSESYKRNGLPVEQRIIQPAIDPLTAKNKDLSDRDISKYLKKFGIKTDKPIISQISRFDKWKDPEGVVSVYKRVREKVDCRLVMSGGVATDDPEGPRIYERLHQKAGDLVDNGEVVLIIPENDIFVNALQRKSAVVIQKSIREGFCLAVTEALWKGTPVVASNVGGIPLQIKDGENGYLLEPRDTKGFADRTIKLLKNPDLAEKMGTSARETVRKRFLITRLLIDYLDLLAEVVK
jgi:trehalose synthase